MDKAQNKEYHETEVQNEWEPSEQMIIQIENEEFESTRDLFTESSHAFTLP